MPKFGPISRKNLIKYMRRAGFEGPEGGSDHQVMIKGTLTVSIPNPHRRKDIGVGLLKIILGQAQITREEWESL